MIPRIQANKPFIPYKNSFSLRFGETPSQRKLLSESMPKVLLLTRWLGVALMGTGLGSGVLTLRDILNFEREERQQQRLVAMTDGALQTAKQLSHPMDEMSRTVDKMRQQAESIRKTPFSLVQEQKKQELSTVFQQFQNQLMTQLKQQGESSYASAFKELLAHPEMRQLVRATQVEPQALLDAAGKVETFEDIKTHLVDGVIRPAWVNHFGAESAPEVRQFDEQVKELFQHRTDLQQAQAKLVARRKAMADELNATQAKNNEKMMPYIRMTWLLLLTGPALLVSSEAIKVNWYDK